MNDETETDKPGLNLWWNIMMMVVVSSRAEILSHFSLASTIVVLLLSEDTGIKCLLKLSQFINISEH